MKENFRLTSCGEGGDDKTNRSDSFADYLSKINADHGRTVRQTKTRDLFFHTLGVTKRRECMKLSLRLGSKKQKHHFTNTIIECLESLPHR